MKKVRILALVLALVLCFSACAQQPAASGGEATQAPTNAPAGNDPTNAPDEPKMYWDMLDEVSDSSELPDWTGKTLEVNLWKAAGSSVSIGTDPKGYNNIGQRKSHTVRRKSPAMWLFLYPI